MKRKLKLKRVYDPQSYSNYPQYSYYIDGICILIYNAPKRIIKQLFFKYRYGLKAVPKDATLLLTRKDREPYDGKFLGGWICEKKAFTYGIYTKVQDRILTAPYECLWWALGKDEIEKFLNYDTIREDQDDL